MRGQHVVVGSNDADVGHVLFHHLEFVVGRHGGEGMRHVGATHARTAGRALRHGIKPL